MPVRITCIAKSDGDHENPHVAITSLGWINEGTGVAGTSTRLQIYDFVKFQGGQAYVRDAHNNTVYLGTAETNFGTRYVRTYKDQTWTDNLLALPECP